MQAIRDNVAYVWNVVAGLIVLAGDVPTGAAR